MPPPPSTSQVSLPSQTGATLFYDDVAIGLFGKQRKQDAETEIENRPSRRKQTRKGDDEGPDGRKSIGIIGHLPRGGARAGVMPAARAGTSLRGPCSP